MGNILAYSCLIVFAWMIGLNVYQQVETQLETAGQNYTQVVEQRIYN